MGAPGDIEVDFTNLISLCTMELVNLVATIEAEPTFLSALGDRIWIIGSVALGLGFVIFVHELGHFLAAKTFGVRCDKFYVGFDVPLQLGPIKLPSSLGKFQWGETEYGIGIIPLGGYVKMLGQDDDPRKMEEETASATDEEGELDPRSYLAKPVWQRMIIISAGVVMNLIFAVIMAGVAYQIGVPYNPTYVGGTTGGSPAWVAGLESTNQITLVGDMQKQQEKLRFDDFRMSVALHGFAHKGDSMPIVFNDEGKTVETFMEPMDRYSKEGFYFVGVAQPMTSQLSYPVSIDGSFLDDKAVDLEAGDTIVAVDGEALPVNETFNKILGSNLTAALQAKWEQPVTVTIERPGESPEDEPTQVELVLPPVPLKTMGLSFEIGPINSIQKGSPAAGENGLKVGDRIKKVNGQEVQDALTLPSVIERLAGQSLTLEVARGEELVEITLQAREKASFASSWFFAGELTLQAIGVAYDVSPIVSAVGNDENSEDSAVQPGDKLEQVTWLVSDEERETYDEIFTDVLFEPLVIDEDYNMVCLNDDLQELLPAGAEFRCIFSRDGKMQEPVNLNLKYSDEFYWHQRGIHLTPLKDIWIAENMQDAVGLGFWETQRRFKSVLNFLKLLVTGKVSPSKLGGPLKIAYVAGAEASNGTARLLLFLTMLSANLAILNFLPIPALDGGHMMFLTFEAIWGKPMNEAIQMRLTVVGFLCLLSLMAFVLFKDIIWAVG